MPCRLLLWKKGQLSREGPRSFVQVWHGIGAQGCQVGYRGERGEGGGSGTSTNPCKLACSLAPSQANRKPGMRCPWALVLRGSSWIPVASTNIRMCCQK